MESNTGNSASVNQKLSVCEGLKEVKGESDRKMKGICLEGEIAAQSCVKCNGIHFCSSAI